MKIISVLEHGADRTGKRDSSAAIQAAADEAAAVKGILYLPPGTYRVDTAFTYFPPDLDPEPAK